MIRRTLAHGRVYGFLSGLGVASADATYSLIAAFGLSVIANLLLAAAPLVRLFGGLFLLYLGYRTFTSPAAAPVDATTAEEMPRASAAGGYASAYVLTFTNPSTILMFAGIFAGLGLGNTGGDPLSAGLLVLGVFSGSAFWWLILTTATGLLRAKFTPRVLRWVNYLSGAMLIAYALMALAGLLSGG